MLRIGEAAKKFKISPRTLRYWEEEGILRSVRAENGYRYYDEENAMRIRQIALLRRIRMPIADIERVFLSGDLTITLHALTAHLENLRRDAVALEGLTALVKKLIRRLKSVKSLPQIFSVLETQCEDIPSEYKSALQILLSERDNIMSETSLNNVRIVKLPAMTVAAYRAESETPENDCGKIFNKFVLENNLHRRDGYRNFGFNNPSPVEGSPVYGYEMWVTIPDGFDVSAPLVKKQFSGGLYASVSTHMNEIGERWQLLNAWCKESEMYELDFSCPCLEECSMDFEDFISEQVSDSKKQLDLLEPVRRRERP